MTTKRKLPAKRPAKPKVSPSFLSVCFRHLKPNWKSYILYADLAAKEGDKEMQRVMQAYNGLSRREQNQIIPEALCDLAGVKPRDLFAAVQTQLFDIGAQEAAVIVAVNQPRIVEKSAQLARTKAGFREREMLLKTTGFLPTPKSQAPSVIINNNPQALSIGGQRAPAALPSMEDEMIQLEAAPLQLEPGNV